MRGIAKTVGRVAAVGAIAILVTGSAEAAAGARPRSADSATQSRAGSDGDKASRGSLSEPVYIDRQQNFR